QPTRPEAADPSRPEPCADPDNARRQAPAGRLREAWLRPRRTRGRLRWSHWGHRPAGSWSCHLPGRRSAETVIPTSGTTGAALIAPGSAAPPVLPSLSPGTSGTFGALDLDAMGLDGIGPL